MGLHGLKLTELKVLLGMALVVVIHGMVAKELPRIASYFAEQRHMLRLLSLPVVKTIHCEDGDIIYCVDIDIYYQNPYGKPQMRPSNPPARPSNPPDETTPPPGVKSIEFRRERCPEGTRPVRRIPKEFILSFTYLDYIRTRKVPFPRGIQ